VADFSTLIDPATLTGYGRAALADQAENQFSLARWLPARQVNDLVFRFSRGGGGLLEAAAYRAYGAEPGFGRREGISRVTGELPPIGLQYVLGEYDQLRLRNSADADIRNLLLRDAARIARSINARFELARGDALVNGSVTLAEKGVVGTVNFARDAAMSVAPIALWSDHTNATPVDDFDLWIQAYVDTNGQPPGAVLAGRRVYRELARSEQIQSQLFPNQADRRVLPRDLAAVLDDLNVPERVTYDAQVKWNGTARRIIPDNVLVFLPAATNANPTGDDDYQLGATLWGTTAEAQEPGYGIAAGDQPGLVVAAFKESKTPVHMFTIGAAIGLPILANPNLAMVATVLAAS
jgi:hypothetical protein